MTGRPRLVLLGLIAAAPAFIGYADFILNHFYRYGAVLLDSGLLADLAWHQGPGLQGSFLLDGMGFYAFHIAPIFVLLSALSRLVPLAMAQWFALVTGVFQALLAVAVYWLLTTEYGLRRGRGPVAAMLLAAAFSFNGLAIAQVRYPHFEILIAAALMLFLIAWWRRQWLLASLFAALCLICREDAGFHLAAMLAVLVALKYREGLPLSAQRPALIFIAVGLTWSIAAVALGLVLFPGHSSFARTYLGTPPLSGLDGRLIATRLLGYLTARGYIFLPALCAALWATARRNPYLAAGYIAFIPWTILHLLAASPLAGTLSSYYGFPYLAAAFFPLIGWRMRPPPPGAVRHEPLVGFALMIVLSFAGLSAQHDPGRVPLWRGFTDPPSFAAMSRIERAMAAIHRDHAALGRVLASDSVAALRPEDFRREETFWDGPIGSRDTLLFFARDRDGAAIAAAPARSGPLRRYRIAGTPIEIATDRPVAALPALAPLLRAARH